MLKSILFFFSRLSLGCFILFELSDDRTNMVISLFNIFKLTLVVVFSEGRLFSVFDSVNQAIFKNHIKTIFETGLKSSVAEP